MVVKFVEHTLHIAISIFLFLSLSLLLITHTHVLHMNKMPDDVEYVCSQTNDNNRFAHTKTNEKSSFAG